MDTSNAVEPHAERPRNAEGEVARLEARLSPCNVDEAMLAILPMASVLPVPKDADEKAFTAAFRLVVWRYPLWAVHEAVAAFIAGDVVAHVSPFCPNPSVFGRELARRVSADQGRLTIARRRAEDADRLAAEPKRIPRSEDARARGEAQIKRLREEAEADRARRNLAHRTGMTRAQIERQRAEVVDNSTDRKGEEEWRRT